MSFMGWAKGKVELSDVRILLGESGRNITGIVLTVGA